MTPEPVAGFLPVIEALEALGVPYFIGGSLASSIHGTMRGTIDCDIVAALEAKQIPNLQTHLGEDYYMDVDAAQIAIRTRDSFNIIHKKTLFKIDVFILRDRPFDRSQLERRQKRILVGTENVAAHVASAEDTILAKLERFEAGRRVSDQQWQDILGILRSQGQSLDFGYLRAWATELSLIDLLERVLAEARVE